MLRRGKYLLLLTIIISQGVYAWMGIEDESVTGYTSLYASLISRALEENIYSVDKEISEIVIINKNVKQVLLEEVEDIDSKRKMVFKDGKIIEDSYMGADDKIKNKIEYYYSVNGDINGTYSYDTENLLVKRSEYRYDSDNLKSDYRAFDGTGRLRVRHKYIYTKDVQGNNRITEEKVFNSAGINVLKFNYAYNENGYISNVELLDYNGDMMRKQEYTYNTKGKVDKFISYNELNEMDGIFEYTYREDGKLDKIIFRKPLSGDEAVAYKYSYNENGIIVEKNLYLLSKTLDEAFGRMIKRSTWDTKYVAKNDVPAVETTENVKNVEMKKSDEQDNNNVISQTKMPDNENEVNSKITIYYKNSTLNRKTIKDREYYEVINKDKKRAAFVFVTKNFGYNGEITVFVIIDSKGIIKDIFVSKATEEKEGTVKMVMNSKWLLQFIGVDINKIDVEKRDIKKNIDIVAGATVTTDSFTISIWQSVELFRTLSK